MQGLFSGPMARSGRLKYPQDWESTPSLTIHLNNLFENKVNGIVMRTQLVKKKIPQFKWSGSSDQISSVYERYIY